MSHALRIVLLSLLFFGSSCHVIPLKNLSNKIIDSEHYKNLQFIDIFVDEASFKSLLTYFTKDKKFSKIGEHKSKNYYFDYSFQDEGRSNFYLKSSGIVLLIKVENDIPYIQLKMNRLSKDPKNSNIYHHYDDTCRIKSTDAAEQILTGAKSILSLGDNQCAFSDSLNSPLKVAKEILKSDLLGYKRIPSRILFSGIKPVAMNHNTIYTFHRHIPNGFTSFQLEMVSFPKGFKSFSLFAQIPGHDRGGVRSVFADLNNKEINYIQRYMKTEHLTFLINDSRNIEFQGLIDSGYLSRKINGAKL